MIMVDARNATATDFDAAAQRHANATWVWITVSAVCGYLFGWFAILPGLMIPLSFAKSISATRCADQLRKGTYRIPNPNNGAPDGDASNIKKKPTNPEHPEDKAPNLLRNGLPDPSLNDYDWEEQLVLNTLTEYTRAKQQAAQPATTSIQGDNQEAQAVTEQQKPPVEQTQSPSGNGLPDPSLNDFDWAEQLIVQGLREHRLAKEAEERAKNVIPFPNPPKK